MTIEQLAHVYTGLGDKDQALAWIKKWFRAAQPPVTIHTDDFSFESPSAPTQRYADLVRRMVSQAVNWVKARE